MRFAMKPGRSSLVECSCIGVGDSMDWKSWRNKSKQECGWCFSCGTQHHAASMPHRLAICMTQFEARISKYKSNIQQMTQFEDIWGTFQSANSYGNRFLWGNSPRISPEGPWVTLGFHLPSLQGNIHSSEKRCHFLQWSILECYKSFTDLQPHIKTARI